MKFVPDVENDVPHSRLRYLLQQAEERADEIQPSQAESFMSQAFQLQRDLGMFLEGASSQELFNGSVSEQKPATNGLLKDFNSLRKSKGATYADMARWWNSVTGMSLEARQLQKMAEKMTKRNAKLQPVAKRPKQAEMYESFLSSSPFENSSLLGHTPATSPPVDAPAQISAPDPFVRKLAEGDVQLATMRRREEELILEVDECRMENRTHSS